jgi:hypothetical protein
MTQTIYTHVNKLIKKRRGDDNNDIGPRSTVTMAIREEGVRKPRHCLVHPGGRGRVHRRGRSPLRATGDTNEVPSL